MATLLDPARLSAAALRVLPRKYLSWVMGELASLPAGPLADAAIRTFVRAYNVDLDEAVIPKAGFRTFDEFFTRELRDGARPIDLDPAVVVSPADGKVEDFGPIDENSILTVKDKPYAVSELVGSDEAAASLAGGSYFIVYLSPRDYHRVHAPAGGPISELRYIPGTLYPVNRIGLEHIEGLFARNERLAIHQQSDFGDICTVMVGAIGVGRIGVVFDDVVTNIGQTPGLRDYGGKGPEVGRGEQLGLFHLGSTAIVFVGPEHRLRFRIEVGCHVRVGEAVAERNLR